MASRDRYGAALGCGYRPGGADAHGAPGSVNGAAFSPDGLRIVTAGQRIRRVSGPCYDLYPN